MAGGPTITVRQIASYPALTPTTLAGNDLLLLQQGGQGGPYASVSVATLVANGLANPGGPALGVGIIPPANAYGGEIFASQLVVPSSGAGGILYNMYFDNTAPGGPVLRYLASGLSAGASADDNGFFDWSIAPVGQAGARVEGLTGVMRLSPAGALSLPLGTLTVARDPASALEVATMGWVGANTVALFNGRRGVVQLTAADVYGALCLDPCDPFITVSQANAAICAGINQAIAATPMVTSFNGRVGNVWLNTCDLNIATFTGPASGLPALMVPTPPAATATPPPDPTTVVNIEWVDQQLALLTGGQTPPFATEAWVIQQIATTTVTSWNGRQGIVLLTLQDVTAVGGAPIASPNFSGIPTAPTAANGTSTAQLATTAFVMNTITALTPGVVSFNGRAGTVTLNATDINNAGGALLESPNFTGTPAAPTAPNGTSTSQIATTAFVMNELTAVTAGVVSFNGRSGVVTLQAADIQAVNGLVNPNPSLTGIPLAPTAANGTNTQQIATTAFVMNEIQAINAGVLTFNGRSGAVTLTQNDVTAVGGLVNPSAALTGTPTAPTPAPTDNSTNIATTAFVRAAVASSSGATVSSIAPPTPNNGQLWFNTANTPYPQLMVWNGTTWAVSTNTTPYAPLASPALTGVPTAPTATPASTSTTQLATTAFVQAAIAAGAVTSFNGRTGAITLTTADITAAGGATQAQLAGYLPLSGGTLTGPLICATGSGGTPGLSVGFAAIGGVSFGNNNGLSAPGPVLIPNVQSATTFATTVTINGALSAPAGTNIGGVSFGGNGGMGGGPAVWTTSGGINAGGTVSAGTLTAPTVNATTGGTFASATIGGVGFGGNGGFTAGSGAVVFNSTVTVSSNSNLLPGVNGQGWVGLSGQAWYGMNITSGGYGQSSDPRLKKDTAAAPAGALDRILAIPVINYRWVEDPETAPLHTGWDASQVQAQLPEGAPAVMVGPSPEAMLSLNILEMIAWLWQAVQELAAKANIT